MKLVTFLCASLVTFLCASEEAPPPALLARYLPPPRGGQSAIPEHANVFYYFLKLNYIDLFFFFIFSQQVKFSVGMFTTQHFSIHF